MKILILLSFFSIFICFSAISAEKTKKKQEFRVEFGFWVANEGKYLDPLESALLEANKSKLVEMAEKKQIQKLLGKDRVEVLREGHVIGTPYVVAKVTRHGKKLGSVYITESFLSQFCKQDTK